MKQQHAIGFTVGIALLPLFGWAVGWGWFFAINLLTLALIALTVQTSIQQEKGGVYVVSLLTLLIVVIGGIVHIFGATGWGWFFVIAGLIVEILTLHLLENYEPSEFSNIDAMSGHSFERFTANLFRSVGYANVQLTSGGGDYGADVLATKNGVRYAVQCKRYAVGNKVSLKAVQEAVGAREYYGCGGAMVITSSYFTKPAINLANRSNCVLIDRDDLRKLCVQQQRTISERQGRATTNKSLGLHHFVTGFLVATIISLIGIIVRAIYLWA